MYNVFIASFIICEHMRGCDDVQFGLAVVKKPLITFTINGQISKQKPRMRVMSRSNIYPKYGPMADINITFWNVSATSPNEQKSAV